MADKLRLGGMALRNGVLVHGPNAWACAVRLPDGTLKVAAREKWLGADRIGSPFLRGPARLAEAMAVRPAVKKNLPEAKLPFEQPRMLGGMFATATAVRIVRGSKLRPIAPELVSGLLALT